MRMIHPAAWAGLLLNVALAFMLFHTLEVMELSMLEMAQQEAWEELRVLILETVRPFYLTLLLMQAVALFLIVRQTPFALPVAFISGLLTIPIGFVYLLGCLLTHYRVKCADFIPAPAGYAGASHIFPSFVLKKMQIFAGVSFVAFVALLLMDNFNISVTFLALTLVGLYCILRAGRNHALALYDDSVTLTPGLLSPRLLLPYSNITLATLHENETIQFEVSTPGGSRSLIWSLLTVDPTQRRQAVEELGAALDARGVPLQ